MKTIANKLLPPFIIIVLLPFLAATALIYYSWSLIISAAIWTIWGFHGRHILFVYSNSPIWSSYIEQEILPHISKTAVILNWSERKQWRISLAIFAFKLYSGHQDFNPMAIVFRPFRFHKIFRFYKAFKNFKHGNSEKLESIKADFFKAIGINSALNENKLLK